MKIKKSLLKKACLIADSYWEVTEDWLGCGAIGSWYRKENQKAAKVAIELKQLLNSE